ncbi:unnamed protein product, partial [Mesorhabditis belari]|uniref:ELMO domain-containing protein n=1 Tax=Mesorhabditis belari TaxID=2138241 RepID=A0AAF3ERL2_9BILA
MVKQISVKYRPLDYVWLGIDRAFVRIASFCAKLVGKSTFQFLVDVGLINAASLNRLHHCIEAAKTESMSKEELEQELAIQDESSRYVLQFLTTSDEKYGVLNEEIKRRAAIKVEKSIEEHRDALDELWKLHAEYEFEPKGDWTLLGFQRTTDPTTDFRSTGAFGLEQMEFFVKYHKMVLEKEVAWPQQLPFALTSIHITAFLMALLQENHLLAHFYAAHELPSLDGINKIHCRLLWLMMCYWMRQCADSIMYFEKHFTTFKESIVRLLHFHHKNLHEITIDDVYKA